MTTHHHRCQILCCFKSSHERILDCAFHGGNVALLFTSHWILTLMVLQREQRKREGKHIWCWPSHFERSIICHYETVLLLSSSSSLSLTLISIWVSHMLPILRPLWQEQLRRKRIEEEDVCVLYIYALSQRRGCGGGSTHRCICGNGLLLQVKAEAAAERGKRHPKFPNPIFNPVCRVLMLQSSSIRALNWIRKITCSQKGRQAAAALTLEKVSDFSPHQEVPHPEERGW